MSIIPGKPFENDIIFILEKGERTNPGSELVAFSRVTDISTLAICDTKNDITLETVKKDWDWQLLYQKKTIR